MIWNILYWGLVIFISLRIVKANNLPSLMAIPVGLGLMFAWWIIGFVFENIIALLIIVAVGYVIFEVVTKRTKRINSLFKYLSRKEKVK